MFVDEKSTWISLCLHGRVGTMLCGLLLEFVVGLITSRK